MSFEITIPAPQPKYPEQISACAPKGMRARIQRAAEAEKVTAADFIRQALEDRVRSVLGNGLAAHG